MKNTMRKNLLNWCDLVSISKKLMFYIFGVEINVLHIWSGKNFRPTDILHIFTKFWFGVFQIS